MQYCFPMGGIHSWFILRKNKNGHTIRRLCVLALGARLLVLFEQSNQRLTGGCEDFSYSKGLLGQRQGFLDFFNHGVAISFPGPIG